MSKYIFPVILIVLQIGASIVYGAFKDHSMSLYWLAAAVVNFAVTFKF